MSVTFGFYNSKEGDRRYDAIQMSSIFDGIIQDGILQHVGTAMVGIHINRKKTRIVKISSKYKFLQIKYTLTDTGKVIKRINPDRVTAMRRKLKKLAVKVENEEADYDNVENMFRGWMGGHYKLLSREQRKNLIQLYEDLFSKEITIVNKKLIVSDRSA